MTVPHSDLLQDSSDVALVAEIANRGALAEAAMSEVFRRFGTTINALALRVLGDRPLADDVTQDVFLGLWRKPERFDAERGKLRTLLMTQAHGRCVDVIRSRNAQLERESKVTREERPAPESIDAELIAITEAEQVRMALEQLPAEERTAIELAYFGANTYRQVAVILDVPEGTIKGRIRAGLKRLHVLLHDTAEDPESRRRAKAPPNGSETTDKAMYTDEQQNDEGRTR